MKPKPKSELKKDIDELKTDLEICDKVIILQQELIELYQSRNIMYGEDRKQLTKCYRQLIKYKGENYDGSEIESEDLEIRD